MARQKDFINILILLSITLSIGIYLIITTILITNDGCSFIRCAQNFEKNPINILKTSNSAYPLLILLAHKLILWFTNNNSIQIWIYSAQSMTLLFRLLAIVPLYFIGKLLVGNKHSFWGIFILILLPYPAEYGSDVLREWPHISFLATALLLLIYGSNLGNWWMFATAGLFAGFGYMIRPECAQIVLYAILWSLIGLFVPKTIGKFKSIYLTLILIIGFLIPSLFYSKIKGEVLPLKLKTIISLNDYEFKEMENPTYITSVIPKGILKALGEFGERICQNLMYIFMLPLMIGLYYHFQRQTKFFTDERLFILALIVLYTIMMMMLHINYGYISRRHFLPMIAFTAFYIPVGLVIISDWLSAINIKRNKNKQNDTQKWFFILLSAGVLICLIKLVGVTGEKKHGYRDAARWLYNNTSPLDIIAVPDKRITFYAQRKEIIYEDNSIPSDVAYVVKFLKNPKDNAEMVELSGKIVYKYINEKKKTNDIVIYRK
ncbi:MAG: hypothetical protein A2Y10_05880 [Planctomycetes bacterium GWF2_41_51]|nr:MAG: hypothetical protein A2Y10_05880 [Planctomycetes bacterium GWF2_41_51]